MECNTARTMFAQRIRKDGALCISFGMGAPIGWPDRYVCAKNWHGWVEVKREDGTVSKNQRDCMESLEWHGVKVCVMRYMGNGAWRIESPRGDSIITTHSRCKGKDILEYLEKFV